MLELLSWGFREDSPDHAFRVEVGVEAAQAATVLDVDCHMLDIGEEIVREPKDHSSKKEH